jgi:Uma2 family endonuclease
MAITPQTAGTIYYPEEDGSLTESMKHLTQLTDLFASLRLFFANQPDVFVGANIAFFYQEGDNTKYYGPDVLVARGVRPRPLEERGSYKLWEEGVVPQVIIELTSASTRKVDVVQKPRYYAALGVAEYYLFDPLGEFLRPRLQGYRLTAAGRYERLLGAEFDSSTLGLRLVERDGWLRLLDLASGRLLPTPAEDHQARLELEVAAKEAEQAAEARRQAAEDEIARLRAEIARLRGEAG